MKNKTEIVIREIGNGYIVRVHCYDEFTNAGEVVEYCAKDLKEINIYLDQYISVEHNKEEK